MDPAGTSVPAAGEERTNVFGPWLMLPLTSSPLTYLSPALQGALDLGFETP